MKKTITLFKDLPIAVDENGKPRIEWEFNNIGDQILKKLKITILPTPCNIDILRLIKIRSIDSPVSLIAPTPDPNMQIKLKKCYLSNNYEVKCGDETAIDVEILYEEMFIEIKSSKSKIIRRIKVNCVPE